MPRRSGRSSSTAVSPSPRPRRARLRRTLAAGVTACAGAALSCVAGVPGTAAPIDDFYTPPAQFATTPGAVVRTEPMPVFVAPPGIGPWPLSAQKVMYTSRTQDDVPVAVTGTYIDATRPWAGAGPRPTIVIAPGTVGQGRQCAPSLAFATGLYADITGPTLSVNQEALSALAWNALGARVFVTDYIGLGAPGVHTYVNRVEEAHAVLDAARAADTLSGTGSETPLAIWGYSQGGGASAAAAELQPSYAPELSLKGVWAGAPVADLEAVLRQVDGNLIGGVIGFALNGFLARYPDLRPELDKRITPAASGLLRELQGECIGDVILEHPFQHTTDFSLDHRPLLDVLHDVPEAEDILRQQRIGGLTPTAPVLITSGRNDDTVPYGQARQLATEWCGSGATVTFRTNELPPILPGFTIPNHFGPELIDGYGANGAISYLVDRLDGKPVPGCTFD
ncbi:lipase family protein [Nocardia sp. alder85J]|uniref:lipase family protein n=1 Tax=Nocardia sp. alder85J TaxID=2862949 RepID=UPI001CD5CC38|nr:lipase family protein [Nocardia sp. alder85J]MCX4098173.1 lipase family protein [Nocardia sp. alder85J]